MWLLQLLHFIEGYVFWVILAAILLGSYWGSSIFQLLSIFSSSIQTIYNVIGVYPVASAVVGSVGVMIGIAFASIFRR